MDKQSLPIVKDKAGFVWLILDLDVFGGGGGYMHVTRYAFNDSP